MLLSTMEPMDVHYKSVYGWVDHGLLPCGGGSGYDTNEICLVSITLFTMANMNDAI